jgi:hypothetical protein
VFDAVFLAQKYSLFTFCLDAKSNKKIKPGPMLSLLRRDRLWPDRPTHMKNVLN